MLNLFKVKVSVLFSLPYFYSKMAPFQDELCLNWWQVKKEDRRNKKNTWTAINFFASYTLWWRMGRQEYPSVTCVLFYPYLQATMSFKLTEHSCLYINPAELLYWIKTSGIFRPDWLTVFLLVIVQFCAMVCKIITVNCIT